MIGSAIVMVAVCCTTYKNPVGDKQPNTQMLHDLCVILALYMARCFFAPFTGGYFNPALTLGVFFNKHSDTKINVKKLIFFLGGQLIGATIGVISCKLAYDINTAPFLPFK